MDLSDPRSRNGLFTAIIIVAIIVALLTHFWLVVAIAALATVALRLVLPAPTGGRDRSARQAARAARRA